MLRRDATRLSLSYAMSASPPPPRRSQRDRKSFKPFDSGISALSCASGAHAEAAAASGRKRKHREGEDEDDAQHATERGLSDDAQDAGEEDEGEGEGDVGGGDEEEEEEYRTPKAKAPGAGRKGKGKATPKAKPGAPVKKPRKTRTAKGAPAREGKKSKEGAAGSQADQQAKDTNIASDNVLFSEFPARYFTRWHVHLTPRRCPRQPSRATSVHRRRLYRVVAPNTGGCTSRAGEPYSALLWVQRLCRR